MKKEQLQKVIETNSKCRTATLQRLIDELNEIAEERELTKKMWFWEGHSSSSRGWYERKRNIVLDVELKGLTVHYKRDYSESCKHVYAKDWLWADGVDSFTLADVNKLIAGLKEIIARRTESVNPKEVA